MYNTHREPQTKKSRNEYHDQESEVDPILPMEQEPSTSTGQQTESMLEEEEATNEDLLPGEGAIKVVMRGHKEDPFYFCSKDDPVWPKIQYE